MGGSNNPQENPGCQGPGARARGFDGFYNGLVLDDNPFEWLTDDWHAWRAGWCRAEADFSEGEAF